METGAPRGKTRMPYTPEHKRETRHKILESALRLFNKKASLRSGPSTVCSSAAMSEGGAEACIRSESAARDDLTKQWSQFPAADRARCAQLATMTKTGSYVQVLTCVEMAREARQLKAPGQHR
jgi:hypothetical protein